jgi:hypothetical protein
MEESSCLALGSETSPLLPSPHILFIFYTGFMSACLCSLESKLHFVLAILSIMFPVSQLHAVMDYINRHINAINKQMLI